ncbi:MAG: ATP-grasp domain-containing protein [Alphaproteobacteria bacterium]|nr:ATP-grasp domain-containing protein [Alphaproteobacteria bacterium]
MGGLIRPFRAVLVANRGEIAVRVFRTARKLGYRTVAVHSTADRDAPFVRAADIGVEIGPPPSRESYLVIDRIIAAAKRAGADAVHPGYGFLSENADFATACAAAGLVFIGPSPEAIRAMGSKRNAKDLAAKAGVAGIPGYNGPDQSDTRLIAEAERIGFPLMVKASAGGGGRGLRQVDDRAKLAAALAAARSEALSAFGDDELILEKRLIEPRHVEVQVFGDSHGNVIHLGERDCSVQRRNQKVIEESPSPAVDANLRARMGEAAVKIAKAIDYVGAGTMEFLLDRDGKFYFLEMNTRLQVEHPVTEAITGLDLVEWQLRVASGEPLPLRQEEIRWRGHAIEVRLYAEDAFAGFLPATGCIRTWAPTSAEWTRVDHGLASGFEVAPYYDPMLAKIVAHGRNREEARRRLSKAVADSAVLGVITNRDFLHLALEHPVFIAGKATTGFIDGVLWPQRPKRPAPTIEEAGLAALLLYLRGRRPGEGFLTPAVRSAFDLDWRGETLAVAVLPFEEKAYRIETPLGEIELEILRLGRGALRYRHAGLSARVLYAYEDDGAVWLDHGGRAERYGEALDAGARARAQGDGRLLAPIMGKVVRVGAKEGDTVAKGQVVVTIEAMKMEHEVSADQDGKIAEINCRPGEQVAARQHLMTVKPS